MLQGKKAYICSPLSAPNPEGVQHNMKCIYVDKKVC